MLYLYGNILCDCQSPLPFTESTHVFTSFVHPPHTWRSQIPAPVGKEGALEPCLPAYLEPRWARGLSNSFKIFPPQADTFSPTLRPHKSFRCNTYTNEGEGEIPEP